MGSQVAKLVLTALEAPGVKMSYGRSESLAYQEKVADLKKGLKELQKHYPEIDPTSDAFLLIAMIDRANHIFKLCRYRMYRSNSMQPEWDQAYENELDRWYDFLKYIVDFDWELDVPLQLQMDASSDLDTLMYSQKRAMIVRFGRA